MSEKADTSVRSLRLGVCEVCGGKEAHYACPKCEVKTCSVACVQIHKRELVCDGVRDRTKFVPLSEMTARELMSDYCFLEQCTRYADDRKCDQAKRYTQQQRYLPVPQHRMRAAAQKRNIQLSLLLPHFSRHKENTTFLDWKQNRFYWRIDWLFVNAAEEEEEDDQIKSARFVDARCDEELTLSALLVKYVDLQQETARENRKLLVRHQTVGIGGLSFWLQAEGVRRSAIRCYHLEANQTLRENLSGKTIVEFPTIFVTYTRDPPAGYETIDSDKESDDDHTGTASDPESEEERTSANTPKKAKILQDFDGIHDVYHALAAAYSDEDGSDTDDCKVEGMFREDIEL
ncbi:box C/D snoRNA protein 1 [Drosophila obscura]|uniref:box C/D snoRNA protein 1 n=1 Tax=Drosophila obscura TaxID=7282 RepID=UPI001BB1538D|nr:box C/D snoRNA protein 1 [Drosophila obscura]